VTRRYIAAGVGATLVIVLFFMVILRPKLGQISDARAATQQQENRRQELQVQLRALQKAEQEAPATVAQLAKFDKLLPTDADLPALIRDLQNAATVSGMDLVSIAPSPPAALAGATGIKTVGVNLVVKGGFFRLESFLARLEDLQRVVEVTTITIAPESDQVTGLQTLSTTITFRMYVVEPNAALGVAQPGPSPAPTASASP
jgi:type IV pilus assembly protein PilO